MKATMATRARLKITRAGICHRESAREHLVDATRFAPGAWGYRDGSVLIYRSSLTGMLRADEGNLSPMQLSRRVWAAFDPH